MNRLQGALTVLLCVVATAACSATTSTTTTSFPSTTDRATAMTSGASGTSPAPANTPAASTPTGSAAATATTTTPAAADPRLVGGSLPVASLTFAEAKERLGAAPNPGGSLRSGDFVNHDGTVFCRIMETPGGCELLKGRVAVAGVCASGGGATTVGRIGVTDTGFVPQCNSDSILGGPVADVAKLAEGQVVSVTGLPATCRDETWGVTCLRTDIQQAFTFGQGGYVISHA